MWDLYNSIMRSLDRLSAQEWLLVFGIVVIIGFFCLRGFGSRSNY
ncbi:MAG: hypothetical protein ACYC35_28340 [Pirellulales bacterium]